MMNRGFVLKLFKIEERTARRPVSWLKDDEDHERREGRGVGHSPLARSLLLVEHTVEHKMS
jgi:hypothetical protein